MKADPLTSAAALPMAGAAGPRRARGLSAEMLTGTVKLADFAAVLAAAGLTYVGYLAAWLGERLHNLDRYGLVALLAAAALVLLLDWAGSYDPRRLRDLRAQGRRILVAWAGICAAGLMIAFATKTSDNYSRGWILSWFAAAPVLLLAGRAVIGWRIEAWRRRGQFSRSVAIYGAGEIGARTLAQLLAAEDEPVHVAGIFDDRRTRRSPAIAAALASPGGLDDLIGLAQQGRIDEIVVALPLDAGGRLREITRKLRHLPVDLRISLGPLAQHVPVRGTSWIGAMPVVNVVDRPMKNWAALVKSAEDKVLSAALLAVFALPMALIALAIRLDSKGPVLFVQERFGFNNSVIRVLKFRTMHTDRQDVSGAAQTVQNDPRITRIGRFLRASSLDELPQLFNVLRGDMSLIGPRAHALKMKAAGTLYFEAVEEYFMRHRVKPGLTGWAQVHGLRGETDTIEKAKRRVEYDLWYIDNWSLWLDLAIVLGTVRIVLKRENAY